jgi:peptide-methionine (S)-S-oxide reductase
MFSKDTNLPSAENALPGRATEVIINNVHFITGAPLKPPFDQGLQTAIFAMGCFWGAERLFWQVEGVYSTAVGYAGGLSPHPTYDEVCSGQTGHTEAVLVVFDPQIVSRDVLLALFWEEHDPTQGNRQGNDRGTQYRSALYAHDDKQLQAFRISARQYGSALASAGKDVITTEISAAKTFYYAEDAHQQYLHKVPNGYCGLAGCNVAFPETEA